MKLKYLILTLCLCTIYLVGCSKSNCSLFKSKKDKILEQVKHIDVTGNINGTNIRIINATKGIYLELLDNKNILYYEYNSNHTYKIDNDNKTKILLHDNYDLTTYLENINYIFTYHANKESLKKYSKETATYLNFDVIKYSLKTDKVKEEFIVVKDTNIGIGFSIESNDKKVYSTISNLELKDTDLTYLDAYTVIEENNNKLTNLNIKVNLNGTIIEFIETSNGVYYNNIKKEFELYFNKNTNEYYNVDSSEKTKILLYDDIDIKEQSEDIYYLLNYHHDKPLYTEYSCKDSKFIGRNIYKYTRTNNGVTEDIYVDKETNLCLYFKLKTETKEIVSKVEKLSLEDLDISYIDQYKLLEECYDIDLKNKNEILSNFNEYHVVLNNDNTQITFIKNEQGILCSISKDNNISTILYDQENDKWYNLIIDSKEKYLNDDNNTIAQYEDSILSLLTAHLKVIDEKFYKEKNITYDGRTATRYIRNIITGNTIYRQEYIIDDITGVCLLQSINLNGNVNLFKVESLSFESSLNEYFEYNEVYNKWPENVDLLEGIKEIEYGTLLKAKYQEDGFNLWYTDINDSFFKQILKDMVACGFEYNTSVDQKVDNNGNIVIYKYFATNDKDTSLYMEYTGQAKSLVIILNKVK